MARTRPTYERKPGIMDRLRKRPAPRQPAEVTTKHSKNPITGTHTTTKTTKTHPRGVGHHGHGGRGPMASTTHTHHTTAAAPVQHHRRKPGISDKVSGAIMKMKGSLTRKPGSSWRNGANVSSLRLRSLSGSKWLYLSVLSSSSPLLCAVAKARTVLANDLVAIELVREGGLRLRLCSSRRRHC